jgi:hypothetical protein
MKKIAILLLLFTISLFANIGKISAFSGDVKVDRNTKLLNATVGFILEQKDTVKTSDNAKAQIVFEDGTVISIGKNAILNINEFINDTTNPKNSKVDVKFAEGAFKTITGGIGKVAPDRFKLQTKSASIGIRGTIIYGNQQMIACTQGEIEVEAGGVRQILPAGTMTKIQQDGTPTDPEPIENEDLGDIVGDIGDDIGTEDSNNDETNPQGDMEIEPLPTEGDEKQPLSDTPNPTLDNTPNTDDIAQTVNSDTTNDTFQDTINNQNEENQTSQLPSPYTLAGYILNYFYDYNNGSTREFETNSTVTITPESFYDSNTINALLYSTYLNQSKTFSYKTSNISYISSLSYLSLSDIYNTQITVDNKGEFVTIIRNYSTNDYPFTDVKTLGYYGKTPTMSSLEANKIYTYSGYAEFILEQYNTGDLSLSDSLNQTVYLNSTNKSIFVDNNTYVTQYIIGDDNDIPYGSEFNILKLNNDGSITGKYLKSGDFSDGYNYSGFSDLTGSLYGSELQGLGFTGEGTTLHNFDNDGTYNQINTAYLDSITSVNNTGILTMKGYLSGFGGYLEKSPSHGYIGGGSLDVIYESMFAFNINQNTGSITSGQINTNWIGTIAINGSVENISSYYIDKDKFGALIDSFEQTNYLNDNYSLETGWFFSIPDSYDSTSDTLSYNLDDDTSWGYWTATLFKDGSNNDYIYNVNNMSTWIAGIETASSAIPTTGSATFSGHILGSVQEEFGSNNIIPILMNNHNIISGNINFGSTTHNITDGLISFQDANANIWKGTFVITDGSGGSFHVNSGITAHADSDINISHSDLNAKFYGDTTIKTLGGNFNMTGEKDFSSYQETYTATGVFKADVQ